jgi:hypothetical protein
MCQVSDARGTPLTWSPCWTSPTLYKLILVPYCDVPLDYKRETSWPKGGYRTHALLPHSNPRVAILDPLCNPMRIHHPQDVGSLASRKTEPRKSRLVFLVWNSQIPRTKKWEHAPTNPAKREVLLTLIFQCWHQHTGTVILLFMG